MQKNMTHTVIGLFDDKTEAQAAMKELVEGGFIKEDIDLADSTPGVDTTKSENKNESFGDSVSNFFSSMFGSDSPEAERYSNAASDTKAILTVQTDSKERAEKAADILDRNDAVNVDERTGGTAQQKSAHMGDASKGKTAQDGRTIPVMEEELQVGKRSVDSGGVRVRSRIVEKPVEEHVRLRTENVVVERHPVDRAVNEKDMANFKEGSFEVTEHSEKAVVGKQARVVEEVSIGKNVTERDQVVRDKVRHTEVDVEEFGQDVKKKKAGM